MPTDHLQVEAEIPSRWYVIHCVTGTEQKVKALIEKRASEEGFSERVLSVFVPSEKVFEMHEGKKRSKVKTFLPGYLLVELRLDNKTRDFILQTPSVLNFVGDQKNKPVPMRMDEVKRFLGKDAANETESVVTQFRAGMSVKITDGPFNNFIGTIQEVSLEKMKLKVMVSIFGRKTPIELDFNQVEEEK
ncbi:MAG: transcription termination/antitermination protein NusG [Bacteroidota bacterium]